MKISLTARSSTRRWLTVAGVAAVAALATSCNNDNYYYYSVNIPNSVAIADVNGDGVPDLLVATTLNQGYYDNPGFANVILNTASAPGTFQTGVTYPTTNLDPSSMAVADLTNSGALDMVVANAYGSVTVFMHGATAGTFLAGVDVATGGAPNQVVIGDVNGDGLPDLVLADMSYSGGVILLLQDPAHPGQFLTPVKLPTGVSTPGVAIADLNGDGAVDIVAVGANGLGNMGAAYVFLQVPTSPGTFLTAASFPAGAQPQSVKVADMNADSLPDLIVANYGPGADGTGTSGVSILMQNPAQAGTFLAPVTYAGPGASLDVQVGALTAAGLEDVVTANLAPGGSGSVSVFLHDPAHPGALLAPANYPGFGQPLGVALGDLNHDGHLDIAVADSSTATVLIQSTSAPGTFAPAVQVGQ